MWVRCAAGLVGVPEYVFAALGVSAQEDWVGLRLTSMGAFEFLKSVQQIRCLLQSHRGEILLLVFRFWKGVGAHLYVGRDRRNLTRRYAHRSGDRVAIMALGEHTQDGLSLVRCHSLWHQLFCPRPSSLDSFSRNQLLTTPVLSSMTPSSSIPVKSSQSSRSRRSVTETRSHRRVPFLRPTARSGSVTQAFLAARLKFVTSSGRSRTTWPEPSSR